MTTSTNKTWGTNVTSTWATGTSWRNDDGSTSSAAPATTATATINNGTVTVAAQTIGNLNINGSCTIAGTSLIVSGNLYVASGATLTFSGTSTLTVNGNLYVDGAIQQSSTTGSLVLGGAGNVEGRFGSSSNYVRVTIAKTAAANTVTFSTDLHCEYVNTTTAGFTFTSGTINQNGFTIYTRTLNNASATARNWAMSGNLYITLGTTGTSVSASQITCTYTDRGGAIRTSGVVSTQTMTFGSGAPSTCPRLFLDNDVTYVISGALWDFYPNGTHTGAATLVVFNELTDAASTNKTYTGMTLNRVASSAGTNLTTNCSARFGTINFYGAWTSGTTYTSSATHSVDFCRANTITNQGIANCTWNFNNIEIGTGFTINQLSTGTKSTVTVNKARPISGVTATTNTWGSSGTGTAGWDIFIEDWDVPGTVTHGGGNLYIGYASGANTYTTNFSSNTTSRAQNFGTYWGDATWIVSKSNQPGAPTNGAVNLNATNFTCNSTNGGWKLVGTGSNALGAMNNTTQQILVYVTGSNVTIGSGTIAYLGVEDGGAITAASTLTINKGYIYRTGDSPGVLTGLNLTLTTSDSYNYNFDKKIGTLTLATSNQTWALDNVVCTNLTLSGSTGCTYNFGGGAVSGTTTCNVNATYNWNGGTLGTSTVWTVGFFVINSTNFNAGVLTFNSGQLVLNSSLNTISFTSASGSTRFINWIQQSRIISSGTGVITINNQTNLTWGTIDNDPYWVGGFQHGGSGAATGLAWTATVPSFRFNTWHTGSGTYSAWYTQTFRALAYSTCTGGSSVFIAGDFYAENGVISLNGIALTQIFSSGTILMDGDPINIASYTHAINDAGQQYLTRLIANSITLTGQRVTYNFGDLANDYYNYVKITTTGTLTLNGKDSSYNLYRVRSYHTTVVAAVSTSDTMYVYVYDYQHNLYGSTDGGWTGVNNGIFTITNGQVTVMSNYTLQTYSFQNGDNARPNRALNFGDNAYLQTNGAGIISTIYSSVCTYTCPYDNSGFIHNSTGSITTSGGNPLGQNNCINLTIQKAATISTSFTCRNFTIVDGGGFNSATVNVLKNWTGYTTNTISGLTVQHILYSGDITYTGNPVGQYTHAVNDTTLNVYNLPAINVTLSGRRSTYNLGSLTNPDNFLFITTTGTLIISGESSTYNLYKVRTYNTTMQGGVSTSDLIYVNCYDYSHNFYNNLNPTAYDKTEPTAGTFTITNGQLTVKSGYTLVTHSFVNADNARPNRACNFENNAYIKTLNTGTLSVLYTPSLTSVSCPYDNCGFYHDSTGAVNITGTPTLSDPNSAYNLKFVRSFAMTGISYIRHFNNQPDNNGLGYGTIASFGGSGTIGVMGNVDITGNIFDGNIGAKTTWQSLSFTYACTSGATQTLSTFKDFIDVGGDPINRINILTLLSTFTGTVKLVADNFKCASAVIDGGTLDLNGHQLYALTSVSSTNGTANKTITTTATNYTVPGIYINATTGTPWSFAYSSLLYSDWRVWVYVRGGTVSHGATARQSQFQPSFDLTERVNAYALSPTTAFQVGSFKINNYTVPTNSVWSVGGPEFTFYTGAQAAPANFTVNIIDGGNSKTTTQLYVDRNDFAWPQFNISTDSKITCSNFKFKNINIDAGTTTASGQFVEVAGILGASGWGAGTLDIGGSTWVFRGSGTVINYGFLSVGFYAINTGKTGVLQFDGLNNTNLGDQYAGFAAAYDLNIVNNISYNTGTSVGTLFLESGYSQDTSKAFLNNLTFGYNTASMTFRSDKPPSGLGFPLKGSGFNLGKTATKYLTSVGGNWGNKGLYNVEATSVIDANYLDLTNCWPNGGGGWYAGPNSVDHGGNTGTNGWYFYSPATFSLSRSASSVDEGNSVTITLTTNAANGSVLPYTITGITSADISGASLTGNFTVSGGTASVVLNISNDYITEGSEVLTFALNNGSASIAVAINDTSLTPTYSLSRSTAAVTEGDSFTISLSTTNLPNGALVPYTITGVDSSDINGASLTGNFTISGSSASLTIVTTWDYVSESQEILTLTLNPTYGTGSAIAVAINNKLHPTYALSVTPTVTTEGGNFTVTLNTTDVPNNTTIPYTITGISSADITAASLTGNFTIVSNTASVTFTTTADYLTEGTETFRLTLDTIGTFVEINILDYYKTRTYALSTSATTVTEGESFTITLTTTNVFDGTTVPYTISGTGITSADINGASLTGNFTITSGSSTQTFTSTIDVIVEGTETFTLTLGSPASGSINVSIRDPVAGSTGNFLSFFE